VAPVGRGLRLCGGLLSTRETTALQLVEATDYSTAATHALKMSCISISV